jgi:NACalpha-BTF3-like transcription factor
MSLVSSNNPESTQEIIQSALEIYRGNSDVPSAIAALSKLKGIGPATASLLLTVHDPEKVIFFSDEAFYWLCCGGKKSPIKYNAKEYQSLLLAANEMIQRLGVSATDIEKVAYVIMKGIDNSVGPKAQKPPVASDKAEASRQTSRAAKRRLRSVSDAAQVSAPARRSKRSKT